MRKIALLMIFMFVAACTPFSPPSILDNLVCEPPCWQNITPGITRKGKTLNMLSEIDNIDMESVYVPRPSWNARGKEIRFKLDNMGHQVSITILFIDNIVSIITLDYNLGVDVEDAIAVFGEPRTVFVNYGHSIQTHLFNEDIGVYYIAEDKYESNDEISPETKVVQLNYFDPSIFPRWFEEGRIIGGTLFGEEFLKILYPWDGFGNIENKYRPK